MFIHFHNLHYEQFADGTVKCIEDEIPFELPNNWAWCRGNLCFKGMETRKPQGEHFDYIDIDAIDNKEHRISSPKHLLVKEAPSRASRKIDAGSVLFSFVRPYLENIAFVEECYSNCIASTGFYICNSSGVLNPKFMFILMTSKYVIDGLNQYMKGDNSPSIRKDDIEYWLYPVPPLFEQLRIVERIESVIPLIEQIKDVRNGIEQDAEIIKSKILDLAIQGKLVPQEPNDEPASVLLERIRAEKEELIKAGKIKRNKSDSVIFKGDDNSYYEKIGLKVKCIDDEIPFDLPKGWTFCRLNELFNVCSSKRVLKSEWQSKGIPFYRAREIAKLSKDNCVDNDLFITEEHYYALKKNYGVPSAGDLMITGVGTIGKAYIVQEGDMFYYKDASVLCFENKYKTILPEFAKLMIDSNLIQNQIHSKTYGNTVDTITITTANNYLCVLPPKKEQEKIVKAVRTANVLIDSII